MVSYYKAIDVLKTSERTAQRNLQDAQTELRSANRVINDIQAERRNVINAAQPKFRSAKRAQELKVFLKRLALTLPLLLISGWLLMKKRESAYWPLYRGFVLFALFSFFVELVPYLPDYGGYVRYGVGIIMAVIAGHFIIRAMRRYIERKQKPAQAVIARLFSATVLIQIFAFTAV